MILIVMSVRICVAVPMADLRLHTLVESSAFLLKADIISLKNKICWQEQLSYLQAWFMRNFETTNRCGTENY